MPNILALNAFMLLAIMLILWRVSVTIRDVSFIDAFWPFGMVILAWTSWLQLGAPQQPHSLAVLSLTTIWGLRLAIHLYTRWRAHGVDPRYTKILGHVMEKKGWSFSTAALVQVWLMQAVLLFIVCMPAQLGAFSDAQAMGIIGWVGVVIALIGIAFETIGDAQLKAFRNDPASKGKVLDTGLWRYTRHPNYFGDACTWWGIWLVAAEGGPGRWAVLSPILITWLLTRLSGVPMLERSLKKSRPGYADYVARTSGFFPLPPKGK
jgi:steroid 5-alpha reductase family enzyme